MTLPEGIDLTPLEPAMRATDILERAVEALINSQEFERGYNPPRPTSERDTLLVQRGLMLGQYRMAVEMYQQLTGELPFDNEKLWEEVRQKVIKRKIEALTNKNGGQNNV